VRIAPLLLPVLLAACGGEISGADRGAEVFESPDLSPSDLNVFSCATCHSTEEGAGPTDGAPGYRLFGVAARSRYWGEDYGLLEDAVSACLVFFMKADPIDPAQDDDDLHALYEYLLSITPDGATDEPYPFTVIETIEDIPRGDAARGEAAYSRACQRCHGEAFSADGSILREEVNLPGVTGTYPDDFPGVEPALVVIEKVRHGRFFNIGGEMPLFSEEALSDDDLGALLSYLEL
jgi:thiosulfate dehydrogenase